MAQSSNLGEGQPSTHVSEIPARIPVLKNYQIELGAGVRARVQGSTVRGAVEGRFSYR